MGNVWSSGPPRDRQKSSDTAPSSPMCEGQAFVFDKKFDGRGFQSLHGSKEEEEPYGTPGQPHEIAFEVPSRPRSNIVSEGTKVSEKVLPTVFRWVGGGKQVYISGTFSEWKTLPMVKSQGNFVTIIYLPEGEYQYKFYVDGEWRHDPSFKVIENGIGSKNNLVVVKKSDFEVFQALDKDSECKGNDAEKEYSQEIPPLSLQKQLQIVQDEKNQLKAANEAAEQDKSKEVEILNLQNELTTLRARLQENDTYLTTELKNTKASVQELELELKESSKKIKSEEDKYKQFLKRLFPEVDVANDDKWMQNTEKSIKNYVTTLQNTAMSPDNSEEVVVKGQPSMDGILSSQLSPVCKQRDHGNCSMLDKRKSPASILEGVKNLPSDDDVSKFFPPHVWEHMDDFSRARYRLVFSLPLDMPESVMAVQMPVTKTAYEFSVGARRRKALDIAETGTKARKENVQEIAIRDPSPESNNAKDLNIPDDHYVYCDFCQEDFLLRCPRHNFIFVRDVVIPQSLNRAIRTAPKKWLKVLPSKIPNAGLGVWSSIFIQKGLHFGPSEGKLCKTGSESKYCWQIRNGKQVRFLDGEDTALSTWLRYVNFARNCEEQNMASYQFKGQIYYRSTVDIPAGSELLVLPGRQLPIDIQNYFSDVALQGSVCRCTGCYLAFKTANVLEKHESRCIYKNLQAGKSGNLTVHERNHSGAKPYKCTVCNKTFNQSSTLNAHECNHSGAKPYKCTVCNKTFNQSSTLTRHERIHSGAKPYKCTVCNQTFNQSFNLNAHERIHSGAKPYKCTVCNKTFNQLSTLTRHERNHSGAKPYKCTVCNKTFNQLSTLTRHERNHSGAKPYKCTVCNKTFNQSSTLTVHERIHSGAKPYKCTVCNKTFNRSFNLTRHERIHSGAKPYKCTVCNKTFRTLGNLTVHERIHSGDRPYKCTVCNKTYAQSNKLAEHERIHSGDRPYKCTVCNKTFNQSSNLAKHKRIHSGDRYKFMPSQNAQPLG